MPDPDREERGGVASDSAHSWPTIGAMRHAAWWIVLVQGVLVVGFGVALRAGAWPLGVRGEWEWLRLPAGISSTTFDLMIGTAAVLAYSGFCWAGMRLLGPRPSVRRETLCVLGLVVAAVAAQG